MIAIKLYDKNTIDAIVWPDTAEASLLRKHVLPMMKEGVQTYIRNVNTELYVLQVNATLIPLTVNQKEYNNSYLTSNYFPIKYQEEQLGKNPSFLNHLQTLCLKGVGLLLKAIKINKVVIVNNWLMTTNIYPSFDPQEIHALTGYLSTTFPDHTLVFRSLNTRMCSSLTQSLEKSSYRLLFARHVNIYDPEQKPHFSPKVLYHHRRDRRLIESEGYEAIPVKQIKSEEIPFLLQLYNTLYLERHTCYSPQYTEKFLKEAVANGLLHLICLRKKGEIHGVIGFHENERTLIAPFCGYPQNKEASHIYRMLTIIAIDEAEKRGILLNDGSGGSAPKQYRGMKPFAEFVALYDHHLPVYRRLFWSLAEKIVRRTLNSNPDE